MPSDHANHLPLLTACWHCQRSLQTGSALDQMMRGGFATLQLHGLNVSTSERLYVILDGDMIKPGAGPRWLKWQELSGVC